MAYIESAKILAFPVAYRGKDADGKPYDPEASLTTERSLRLLSVARASSSSNVRLDGSEEAYILCIGGYVFRIAKDDLTSFLNASFPDGGNVYAGIRLYAYGDASGTGTNSFLRLIAVDGGDASGETSVDNEDGTFHGLEFASSMQEAWTMGILAFAKDGGDWEVPEESSFVTDSAQVRNADGHSILTRLDTSSIHVSDSVPHESGYGTTISSGYLDFLDEDGHFRYQGGTFLVEGSHVEVTAGKVSVHGEIVAEGASSFDGNITVDGDVSVSGNVSSSSLEKGTAARISDTGAIVGQSLEGSIQTLLQSASGISVVSEISQDGYGKVSCSLSQLQDASESVDGLLTYHSQTVGGVKTFADGSADFVGSIGALDTLQGMWDKYSGSVSSGLVSFVGNFGIGSLDYHVDARINRKSSGSFDFCFFLRKSLSGEGSDEVSFDVFLAGTDAPGSTPFMRIYDGSIGRRTTHSIASSDDIDALFS